MDSQRRLLDHLSFTALKLISAIERQGSLSKAAATLNIVPSAASRRISQLEQSTGRVLLQRTSRGVELTPAGHAVARYAHRMLGDVDALDEELHDLQAGIAGHIKLVASISAIVQHLPQDLAKFLRAHETIRVDLAEHTSSDIVDLLLQQEADLGVFVSDGDIVGLRMLPYRAERLVVILPEAHRLATRASLRFEELLDEEWVELPPKTALADRLANEARKLGVRLRSRIQVKGMDSASRMVQCGLGIGLLPQASLQQQALFSGLASVPLDEPWANRTSYLAMPSKVTQSPACQLLVKALLGSVV